ncbi:MFS transporter [Pseudomonas sp. NPDC089407]|uniref:MFS transporter n=1 Tax=Pseudomonas sp. NPDC089407 TaxID=3364464 RepID=UPI00384B49C6
MNKNVLDVHTFLDDRPIGKQQKTVIILGLLILMLDGFDTMMMGFIAPALLQDWGIERGDLGPLMMSGIVGLSLGSLIAGPLADRFGRRGVIIVAVSLVGLFCLACAFTHDLHSLTVARLLTGVGLGATMPNITTLLAECAPLRRRSLLVTSAWCGFGMGGAICGLVSEHLIELYTWRSVFITGGVLPLLLVVALIVWLPESLRYRLQRNQAQERMVAAANALVAGSASSSTRFVNSELDMSTEAVRGPAALLSQRYRLGTLTIWLAMFMGFFHLYFLTNWLPLTAKAAGMSFSQGATLGILLQLGGAIGNFTVGLKMDRFEPNRIVSIMFAGCAVFTLLIALFSSSFAAVGALVFFMGYVLMSANAGCFALGAAHYPTPIRATGVSWVFGIGRVGAILGAGSGAVITTWGWTITDMFVLLAVPVATAAVAIHVKRRMQTKALSTVTE